jgi:hypothetical protein
VTIEKRVYCLALCPLWGTVLGPHGVQTCWILLNRRYEPFGSTGDELWYDYDEYAGGIRLWLDADFRRAISNGTMSWREDDTRVWLYSDATNPNRGKALEAAYQRRLAMLETLMVKCA